MGGQETSPNKFWFYTVLEEGSLAYSCDGNHPLAIFSSNEDYDGLYNTGKKIHITRFAILLSTTKHNEFYNNCVFDFIFHILKYINHINLQ